MTATEVESVRRSCDEMSALVNDLVACSALTQVYDQRGDTSAAEGCKQTMQMAVNALREHIASIVKAATLTALLLLIGLARADSFDDHLRALEARNAAKPAPVAQEAVQQPRHGDIRPASDGLGDWTWTDEEGGYWWRYRPDWVQPPAAPSQGGGGFMRSWGGRMAVGGCISG